LALDLAVAAAAGLVVALGKAVVGAVVVVGGQGDLLEVVGTLDPGRGGADLLDGGQQQSHQGGDDGDDDQQFDQGEGAASGHTAPRRLGKGNDQGEFTAFRPRSPAPRPGNRQRNREGGAGIRRGFAGAGCSGSPRQPRNTAWDRRIGRRVVARGRRG